MTEIVHHKAQDGAAPAYCVECSEAAQEWIAWPCSPEAVVAAVRAQESLYAAANPQLQGREYPPPPRPVLYPRLPNPAGLTENGRLPCNEPLEDTPGVYCDRLVKVNRDGTRRGHRRKPHRFEWRSRA